MYGGNILEKRERRPKKRKWLRYTLIVLAVVLIGLFGYLYSIYHSFTKAVDNMHTPIRETSEKRTQDITLKNKDPFSVLLLGVDQRKNDRGRSDTIIVMTVNPRKESIEMVSIPRDTRTEIVGRGTVDKINHAYAFGGVEMSMDTVENFLDIPIDYFVQVNMEGFKEIVDSVGGVTVNNDLDFTYEGKHFPKGQITLNGNDALKFSRMRKQDPRGDFGRQLRQRQIIEAVVREGASLKSLTNYGDIFSALGNNVKTNLTFDEMVDIQANYRSAVKEIDQKQLKGSGTKINKIYYFVVPDEERTAIQDMLKEHLEIK
ncbi:polyisoprenyl-teichoic acid--peptidoglycan teichoic acid transferase TagU [Bacillus andreraoultii]|uniref:polyisoprenyl-teichoic acid--peptidoglycan teichoic acid transferase TagU n=1 Tax=Bacillus andreraoultii TaxID=1499685 RepID=UPI00053A0F6D|nr:LytR family transcriptional regulator [Bacillus andreraoultii]